MNKNYEVRDEQGRLWEKTLTQIKAAKVVEFLREAKGLVCHIEEVR